VLDIGVNQSRGVDSCGCYDLGVADVFKVVYIIVTPQVRSLANPAMETAKEAANFRDTKGSLVDITT
jgi:hypothetical protein